MPEHDDASGLGEDQAITIARLTGELKAAGSVNYRLQEAAAIIVANNDRLRRAIRTTIERLAVANDIAPSKDLSDTARDLDEALDLNALLVENTDLGRAFTHLVEQTRKAS